MIRAFVASLDKPAAASEKSVLPTLQDGLRAQAVLDAALASTRRGGWVDVVA